MRGVLRLPGELQEWPLQTTRPAAARLRAAVRPPVPPQVRVRMAQAGCALPKLPIRLPGTRRQEHVNVWRAAMRCLVGLPTQHGWGGCRNRTIATHDRAVGTAGTTRRAAREKACMRVADDGSRWAWGLAQARRLCDASCRTREQRAVSAVAAAH
eukprot:5430408-Prymnesium_polylepis.1